MLYIDLKWFDQVLYITSLFGTKIIGSIFIFFKLGFTPCKGEQPPQGMELQEKEAKKD